MKIFIYSLLLTLIICNSSLSNKNYFILDTLITIPNDYIDPEYSFLNPDFIVDNGNVLVYFPTENDSLIFYKYNLKKKSGGFLFYPLTGTEPPFEVSSPICYSFNLDSEYIYLHFFEGFVIFKILDSNKVKLFFSKKIVEPSDYSTYIYSYDYSWFDKENSKIFFARNYNRNVPIENFKKNEIAIFDIKSNSFIKKVNPYLKCIEFTHFMPIKLIDVNKKFIVFSQTIEYRISVFDKELNNLYDIQRTPVNWISLDTSKLDTLRKQYKPLPASVIIHELDDYKIPGSRIIYVTFVDDSLLAVFYTSAKIDEKIKGVAYFDLWRIAEEDPILILSDILIPVPSDDTKCTRENYPIYPTWRYPTFNNNKVVTLYSSSIPEIEFQPNIPYKQIKIQRDRYIGENDINYLLGIFDFLYTGIKP